MPSIGRSRRGRKGRAAEQDNLFFVIYSDACNLKVI
jgi:hypothetical protein